MGEVLRFLLTHLDLIEILYEAIARQGVDKRRLVEAVKREMVQASDEAMRQVLLSQ